MRRMDNRVAQMFLTIELKTHHQNPSPCQG